MQSWVWVTRIRNILKMAKPFTKVSSLMDFNRVLLDPKKRVVFLKAVFELIFDIPMSFSFAKFKALLCSRRWVLNFVYRGALYCRDEIFQKFQGH